MGQKRLRVPTEFDTAGDTGKFVGYAAVFGNVDLGGDVVAPGAFKEVATNSEGRTVVLWQHDARTPIGTAAVRQDAKGLAFEGSLVMEDDKARIAYAHMKAKSVEGMSIGYDVLPNGATYGKDGTRILTGLKLWELSIVTFPMNPLAGIDAVKSAESVRELEGVLRDVLCLSSRKSKAAANALWPILAERDAQEDDREDREAATLGRLAAQIEALNLFLTKGI